MFERRHVTSNCVDLVGTLETMIICALEDCLEMSGFAERMPLFNLASEAIGKQAAHYETLVGLEAFKNTAGVDEPLYIDCTSRRRQSREYQEDRSRAQTKIRFRHAQSKTHNKESIGIVSTLYY